MDKQEKIDFLAQYLPSSKQISNTDTAAAVADVWLEMLRLSPWDSVDQAKFKEGMDVSLISHVNSTVEAALAVSRIITRYHKVTFDEEKIIILGLLHDVDKIIEYLPDANGDLVVSDVGQKIQHGVMTAILAYQAGFDTDMLHMILTHTSTQNMKTIFREGLLFEHIDICDWEMVVKFYGS